MEQKVKELSSEIETLKNELKAMEKSMNNHIPLLAVGIMVLWFCSRV